MGFAVADSSHQRSPTETHGSDRILIPALSQPERTGRSFEEQGGSQARNCVVEANWNVINTMCRIELSGRWPSRREWWAEGPSPNGLGWRNCWTFGPEKGRPGLDQRQGGRGWTNGKPRWNVDRLEWQVRCGETRVSRNAPTSVHPPVSADVRAWIPSYSYSAEQYSYLNAASQSEPIFVHEKLDRVRAAIQLGPRHLISCPYFRPANR
jgi:hypothetical protein